MSPRQRQSPPNGRWGRTKPHSVSLPIGMVAVVDELAAERAAAGVWPDTRSGVLVGLIEAGLELTNTQRSTPLWWQPELELDA